MSLFTEISLSDLPWQALLLLLTLLSLILSNGFGFFDKRKLPPSPPKLPLVGNLHQIGALPHRSLAALAGKHGPLMLLRMGYVRTLIVSSPEMAREIMRVHDSVFCDRPSLKAPRTIMYDCTDVGFVPYGDYWRHTKKLCNLHLLSVKKVQSYNPVREDEVALLIRKVEDAASRSASREVNMSEMLNSFINDLVCRVIAGNRLRESGRDEVIRQIIKDSAVIFGGFFVEDFFPAFGWLDNLLPLGKKSKRMQKRWDDFFEQIIEEHDPDRVREDEEKNFLHTFLAEIKENQTNFSISRDQLKGLLVDLFAGGTDTTYVTAEWAIAELVKDPRRMKKAQEEVRERATAKEMVRADEVDKMVYLKAVIKETMRLHPPAPLLLPRVSMEDCHVDGYFVPKRTRVMINAWAIGRDPRYWEEPDVFNPERFLVASGASPDFKGNDFQFIPFGAGRRICPGLPFAIASVELSLANLLQQFDWELPSGSTTEEFDMGEVPGLTMRKREALRLVPKPWKT